MPTGSATASPTNIIRRRRQPSESDLAALRAIPRDQLDATDQLAYDVFEYTTKDTLRGYEPDILSLTKVRPLNHFYGIHTFYPTFASGKGGAPFNTVQDYENNLKRHNDFVVYVDRAIGRFKEGQAAGVVETRMTVRNMIEQLGGQLKMKPEDSPYLRAGKAVSGGDWGRRARAADAGASRRDHQEIYPALTRLRDYLKANYLPTARDGVGLMYMKGGDHLYRYHDPVDDHAAADPGGDPRDRPAAKSPGSPPRWRRCGRKSASRARLHAVLRASADAKPSSSRRAARR